MTMMYSWIDWMLDRHESLFVLGKMNQRTQDAYDYALRVEMGR